MYRVAYDRNRSASKAVFLGTESAGMSSFYEVELGSLLLTVG